MAIHLERPTVIPDVERDRRHRALRGAMAEARIDVLVMASDAHHKGDVLYVTNHAIWSQRAYAVMTQEAGPFLAVPMASQDYWARAGSWATEVAWSATPVRDVVHILGSLVRAGQTVGISGLKELVPLSDHEQLRAALASATVVDATDVVQGVRARKGDAEIAGLRAAADVARAGFAVLSEHTRPGVTEFELVGEVERVVRARGAGTTLILTSEGPYLRSPSARVLRRGDFQMFSVELCGPSGYWAELGGMLAIGSVDDSAGAAYRACRSAFDAGLGAIRAGQKCSAVAAALTEAFQASGHKAGIWGGHGIGLDTLEKPRLTANDGTVIAEGMAFGFHPHVVDASGTRGAYIADTVVVTAGGLQRLGDPAGTGSMVHIGGGGA